MCLIQDDLIRTCRSLTLNSILIYENCLDRHNPSVKKNRSLINFTVNIRGASIHGIVHGSGCICSEFHRKDLLVCPLRITEFRRIGNIPRKCIHNFGGTAGTYQLIDRLIISLCLINSDQVLICPLIFSIHTDDVLKSGHGILVLMIQHIVLSQLIPNLKIAAVPIDGTQHLLDRLVILLLRGILLCFFETFFRRIICTEYDNPDRESRKQEQDSNNRADQRDLPFAPLGSSGHLCTPEHIILCPDICCDSLKRMIDLIFYFRLKIGDNLNLLPTVGAKQLPFLNFTSTAQTPHRLMFLSHCKNSSRKTLFHFNRF